MKDELKEKVAMATQVGKLLPETKEKVSFYKETIEAESELINAYQKRQSSIFVFATSKAKEKAEIVRLKNSIAQKEKLFSSYLKRKNEYENWLDEIAIEVNENFDDAIAEARLIPSSVNPRLQDGINKFESLMETNTLQDRVEFYLFVKNEIDNHRKFGKKK
jgi:hypothetical protein